MMPEITAMRTLTPSTSTTPRIVFTAYLYPIQKPTLVANVPNNTPVVFQIGLSDQVWVGGSLPFGLGVFGAPGCNLYVSLDSAIPTAAVGTNAGLSIPIPSNRFLIGTRFYLQALVIDPAANRFGLTTSNVLACKVGGLR